MTALRDYNAAVDFVDRNVAEGRGEKTAFIDPSRNLTYGELRDAAARIGPMLARMGIEPENRIALVLLDTVDFPVLFWGAIRAGIVPVLVNTRLTVDQYHYLFEDSRAKACARPTAPTAAVARRAGRETEGHARSPAGAALRSSSSPCRRRSGIRAGIPCNSRKDRAPRARRPRRAPHLRTVPTAPAAACSRGRA